MFQVDRVQDFVHKSWPKWEQPTPPAKKITPTFPQRSRNVRTTEDGMTLARCFGKSVYMRHFQTPICLCTELDWSLILDFFHDIVDWWTVFWMYTFDAFGKTWQSEHSPCHGVCVCVCVLQKCSKDFATKCWMTANSRTTPIGWTQKSSSTSTNVFEPDSR